MSSNLNSRIESDKWYHGRAVDQMPKLIADGRVPMNVSQLMQRRLNRSNFRRVRTIEFDYINDHFNTGDAVVYHPDGRVKIVLDSQRLREINPQIELRNRALVSTEEDYNSLQGEEFKDGELRKTERPLSREDVKAHPVWKVLARDQALLNDYADFIFGEYQLRFAKDTPLDDLKLMGVYLDSASNYVKMRDWFVYGIANRSIVDGRLGFSSDYSRLVGIASEEPIEYTLQKLQTIQTITLPASRPRYERDQAHDRIP